MIGVVLVDKCSAVVAGESCTATARAFGPDGELSNPSLFWQSSDSRIFSVTGASTEAIVFGRTPGSATMTVGNRSGSVRAESPVRVIPG
jgi:hypothetical protein